MKKIIISAFLLGALLQADAVWAQNAATVSTNIKTEGDAKKLSEIMGGNMYIMMLSKLASLKASNTELRRVAGVIATDHQRFDGQLTALANRQNMAIDPDLREKYMAKLAKYDSKPVGTEWDDDITEELIDLHKDGIDMLQDAQGDVKDAQMKEMIAMPVKTMQGHLDMLMPLKSEVKKVTGATTPPVTGAVLNKEAMKDDSKDAKFVSDMMEANTYEVKLMELILKKGNHRDLKNAAQTMLEDHSNMMERLTVYATKKHYGVNAEDAADMNEKIAKWETKRGGMEWDADLVEELNDMHKDAIDQLQDAKTDVRDAELVTIIEDTLPILQRHQQSLDKLKDVVKKPWEEKK